MLPPSPPGRGSVIASGSLAPSLRRRFQGTGPGCFLQSASSFPSPFPPFSLLPIVEPARGLRRNGTGKSRLSRRSDVQKDPLPRRGLQEPVDLPEPLPEREDPLLDRLPVPLFQEGNQNMPDPVPLEPG